MQILKPHRELWRVRMVWWCRGSCMFNKDPRDTDAGGSLGPTLGPCLLGGWSPAVLLLVDVGV